MIIVRRIKNIDKIPGLVSHIEQMWGIGHQIWCIPERFWFVGFEKIPNKKLVLSRWICYGGVYSYSPIWACAGPTYVKPEYRGQGLQLALLKKRIKLVKEKGYQKIWSSTYNDNYPSMNNLIKAGFFLTPAWCEPEPNSLYWYKNI